jgi:hypothetical protein
METGSLADGLIDNKIDFDEIVLFGPNGCMRRFTGMAWS